MFHFLITLFIIYIASRFISDLSDSVKQQFPNITGKAKQFIDEIFLNSGSRFSSFNTSPNFESRLRIMGNELEVLFGNKRVLDVIAAVEVCISLHMAKSDGYISDAEMKGIRDDIIEKFGDDVNHSLIAEGVGVVKKYIKDFNNDELVISAYFIIDIWGKILQNHLDLSDEQFFNFVAQLFSIIYRTALTDGMLKPAEETFFKKLCNIFKLDQESQDYLIRMAIYQNNAKKYKNEMKNDENDRFRESIKLFNLKPDYSSIDLEKAWKDFIRFNHPDKFHNVGEEIYRTINAAFVDGKNAYEFLKGFIGKERPYIKEESKHNPGVNSQSFENIQQEKYSTRTSDVKEPKKDTDRTFTDYKKPDVTQTPDSIILLKKMFDRLLPLLLAIKKHFLELIKILYPKIQIYYYRIKVKIKDIKKFVTVDNLKKYILAYKKKAILTFSILIFILGIMVTGKYIRNFYYFTMLDNKTTIISDKGIQYFVNNADKFKPDLIEIIDSSENEIKRVNALIALINIDKNNFIYNHYIKMLINSHDHIVKERLMYAIGIYPVIDDENINSALETISTEDQTISLTATNSLRKIGGNRIPINEINFGILYKGTDNQNPDIRLFCLDAILYYESIYKNIIINLFVEKLADESKIVQLFVSSGLNNLLPGKGELYKWLQENNNQSYIAAINTGIMKTNEDLNRNLIVLFNNNPEFYSIKEINTMDLLLSVNDETLAKDIITTIKENNIKNSILFDFAYKCFATFGAEFNSEIIDYYRTDINLFCNFVKNKIRDKSESDKNKVINLLYSCKDERLEYKTLAKYILQVNNNDKLQRAKLNDIILSN